MIYTNGQHDVSITGGGIIDACGGKMARWGMAPEQLEREAGGGKDSAAWQEITHGTHGETIEMPDVRRLREMGSPSEGEPRPVSERVFGKGTFLRPCAIEFYDCKNVRLEGFTLKNSPFWCIHPVYCDSVTVRGVTIDSHYPNNDGCDPESSSNVLIEDCLFRTGDDAVAIKSGRDADGWRVGRPSENITIRNCRFFSECNGLCIGSEMSGGVRNVRMENVEIGKVKNALLFKSNLDRGGYIRDVVVKNITIEGVHGAVLRFETNYFGYRGGNSPAQYENFHIAGVKAGKAEGYGIYYDGNEQCPIRNVAVEDFHVESATHPYYLYHTQNCTFTGCTVGGVAVPEHPEESKERQSCDVW
jgi:polygalacturonase